MTETRPNEEIGSDTPWYLLGGVDSRAKWFTICLLVISFGMLIAGSVMLGIGISNNNHKCDDVSDVGYTVFLTVQAKQMPYSSVVTNYAGSVQNLTDQMRDTLTQPAKSSMMQSLVAQSDLPITILGISNAGSISDVMYAISYSGSNKPSLGDVQSKVAQSSSFVLLSATDKTAGQLNQMECATVSNVQMTTSSTSNPSQSTTSGNNTPNPATTTKNVPTGTAPTGATAATSVTSGTGGTASVTGGTTSVNSGTTSVTGGSTSVTGGSTQPTPNSSQTTGKPPVTVPPKTTTTPFVKTAYSKDIIILLDDSTAMINAKNFNTVKSWITKSLLPLWVIDRENVQVAFVTFADNEFNTLLDFDENTEDEVSSVISNQIYSGKHTPSISFGVRGATGIQSFRPVNQTTILLSGSENLTDIEDSTNFAYKLNTLPKQLITIALNSTNNGKQLGLLSTSQNTYFGSTNFTLDDQTAKQLTEYIFGISSPTTAQPTTTAVPDNSCKADITILIDCSNDVGSDDQFHTEIGFIRSLVKSWPIAPELVEAEAILFSSVEGGMIVENAFQYQTASTFANELLTYNDYYFAGSPPTIKGTLEYLSTHLDNRRSNRQQTTILITYSSNNADVQNAIPFANLIGGNLVILAIDKSDPSILSQLSGNVLYSKTLSADLIANVNNLICSTSTKAPLRSTSIAQTTTLLTTSKPVVTTQTTSPPASTTPLPDQCPDCIPKTANLLILMEAFGTPFADQKNLVENALVTKWNHFERVNIIGFDSVARNDDPINFGDLNGIDDFKSIVDNLVTLQETPTIVSAFQNAVRRAQPLKKFGKMNSIIFTSGANADEIKTALNNSQILRKNGKVIIVGLNLTSATGLETLCDVLLNWKDFKNIQDISVQINAQLN